LAVADELEVLVHDDPQVLEDPAARRRATERLLEVIADIDRFERHDAPNDPATAAGTRRHEVRRSSHELLAAARARLGDRLTPAQAHHECDAGSLLVDIRPYEQRRADGLVPGAHLVDRNVLEWRLDPTCPWRHPALDGPHRRVILLCDEGYQSSLAAATLVTMGLDTATDVIGGFRAWRLSGLPVAPSP
jgi:rhodanese-related sulfurtransferase